MKFYEENIQVQSFHYKLSKETQMLSAFKIQYSHGVVTPLLKAKDETEDDMQIVSLTEK